MLSRTDHSTFSTNCRNSTGGSRLSFSATFIQTQGSWVVLRAFLTDHWLFFMAVGVAGSRNMFSVCEG
jgi:hypothetical protein